MKLSHTKLVFLSSAGFALGAIGVLAWIIVSSQTLGERLELAMKEIANQQAAEETLRELERSIEETEAERAQVSAYVLSEGETISFLSQIEAVGRGLGLEFSTESLQVEERETVPARVLRVAFRADGATGQIRQLLGALETLPYHSRIDSLSLQQDGQGTGSVQVTVLVSLHREEQL